jgi:amino acid adenylation domain-containing protein
MLVQDFLQQSAERYPDKAALVCGNERHTYAWIEERSNCLANALIANGLQRGDRVAVYLQNSVESVLSIFAILKAAGVFVVLNPTTKKDKLAYILNKCGAAAIITTQANRGLIDEVRQGAPALRFAILCNKISSGGENGFFHDLDELLEGHPADRPQCLAVEKDLACLIFTSGSTGDPKGVVSGHDNVVFASGSIIEYLENSADDVVINFLPLSFDYGLYQLLMTFRFGGTLVLEPSFAFFGHIFKLIETEGVTGLPGVPTVFSMMLRKDLSKFDLSRLRYISNTGAAFPASHIQTMRKKLPGVSIYSMYGLTECKRTLYLPPDQVDRRPDSVGIPIPGTEVWIEDKAGRQVGPGEVGELVIRGPHVMRGYWDDPEATARVYRPGPEPGETVLYSGDLFRRDEEGFHYFVARKDDVIKSRGEKVSPREVETVLCSLEGVAESAVVGVPDEILGQAIKAVVVRSDATLTEQDVLRHCSRNLENFMVPNQVEFRESLPRTGSGKVDYKALR